LPPSAPGKHSKHTQDYLLARTPFVPGAGEADRPVAGVVTAISVAGMAAELDPAAMLARFRERAAAVRSRGIPPVEGPDRKRLIEQAELDHMDFAILGDGEATLEDGVLTIRVDLRPRPG
jgi:hypothetical protein